MDWIFEGFTAALWQLAAFAGLLILSAASLWSCEYLGISPGFGILSFYVAMILSFNLFLAWKSKQSRLSMKVEE